jgi:DNA polymerase-3 subunit epsilon
LIALLKESAAIKSSQPKYNAAQKNTNFSHGLYVYTDQKGYLNLIVKKISISDSPLQTFTSLQSGKKQLNYWLEKYGLCQRFCNLYKTQSACFNHSIKQCSGACIGEETANAYNAKVTQLMNALRFDFQDFLILDKGRASNEYSFVCLKNGNYAGYGYIYRYLLKRNLNNYQKFFIPQETNRDFQSIIRMQLDRDKKLEIQLL